MHNSQKQQEEALTAQNIGHFGLATCLGNFHHLLQLDGNDEGAMEVAIIGAQVIAHPTATLDPMLNVKKVTCHHGTTLVRPTLSS